MSNAPTCVSNATVGFLIAGGDLFGQPALWMSLVAATLCFYEAGLILNDFCDHECDRLERPARPLPSGRIRPADALVATLLLFALAMMLILAYFPQGAWHGCALIALIFAYNLSHQRFSGAPLLMGLCRGMIYLLASSAVMGFVDGRARGAVAVLVFYILSVSWIARGELSLRIRLSQKLGAAGVILALVGACVLLPARGHGWALSGAILVAVLWSGHGLLSWLRGETRAPATVGRLLAGICLLDAVLVAGAGSWLGVLIAWTCFAATLWGHSMLEGS